MNMCALIVLLSCAMQGAIATEPGGEKIKVSSEFAAACSFLSAEYTREFTTPLPSYTKKDVKYLGTLIGCTTADEFKLKAGHLKQHRHARALIAALHLGLQPRVNEQLEVVVDRLPLLRTTLWNRLLDDKEVDAKVSEAIENNSTLKTECIDQLVKRMPWRAVSLLYEIDQPDTFSGSFCRKSLAMGMYKRSDGTEDPAVFGVRNVECPPKNPGDKESHDTICVLGKLDAPFVTLGPRRCICTSGSQIDSFAVSPCGHLLAYIGNNFPHGKIVKILDQKGVVVFDHAVKSPSEILPFPRQLLQFTEDNRLVFMHHVAVEGGSRTYFEEWDLHKKEKVCNFFVPVDISAITLSHDGKLFAGIQEEKIPGANHTCPRFISIFSRETGELLETIRDFKMVHALGFTQDNILRAVGSREIESDDKGYVWEVHSKKLLCDLGAIEPYLLEDNCFFDLNSEKVLFRSRFKFHTRLVDVATQRRVIDYKMSHTNIFPGSFNSDGLRMVNILTEVMDLNKSRADVPLLKAPSRTKVNMVSSEVMMWLSGAEQLKEAKCNPITLECSEVYGYPKTFSIEQLIQFARTGDLR